MQSAKSDSDFYKWGQAIKVILPRFEKGGTHVNISGAAVLKNSMQAVNAQKLIEFLSTKPAQNIYAQANFEYPIHPGVMPSKDVLVFGNLQKDNLLFKDLVKNRQLASELVDKVRFDY
jgi:iron(III) transport system substrate-binding protein